MQSVDQLAEPTPGRVTEALDAVGPLHPGKLLTDIGVDGAGKGGVDCGEVKHEDGATDSPVPLATRCEPLEQVSGALGELRKHSEEETLPEALGEGKGRSDGIR